MPCSALVGAGITGEGLARIVADELSDAALPVTLGDGVEAPAAAEAATGSCRSGRTVELRPCGRPADRASTRSLST